MFRILKVHFHSGSFCQRIFVLEDFLLVIDLSISNLYFTEKYVCRNLWSVSILQVEFYFDSPSSIKCAEWIVTQGHHSNLHPLWYNTYWDRRS